jgi:hypothetical protein
VPLWQEAEVAVVNRSSAGGRRLVIPAFVFVTACAFGPCGTANATPVFDVDAYSACTATTVPGPDQDFDAVVTTCCVQNAGVPTPTNYGMGCVAPMDGAPADERPLIVLPTRPVPPQDADADVNGLVDMPIPDPAP